MSNSRLTAKFVANIRTPGKYGDQNGLLLRVERTGRRYWEQRFTVHKRPRTMGIGPYPLVSLREARETAFENLKIVRSGGDPIALRRASKGLTLAEAVHRVVDLRRPTWSHPRQPDIWIRSFEQYVFPRLGAVPVSYPSGEYRGT